MNCNEMQNAKLYLARFFQILNQMEQQMTSAKPIDNITVYFIHCMVPHHQAAIYMCENLLKYTNYQPLENIANNIIQTQTEGIRQMKEIAQTTQGFNNCPEDVKCYTKKYLSIAQNMFYRMKHSRTSANINLNFTSEMIPHHEGAIAMCNNLLQYCIDPRLAGVARNIIREQSEGVRQLELIQKNLSSKKLINNNYKKS